VSAGTLARLAAELPAIRRVSVTKNLELLRRGNDLILRRRREPTPQFEFEVTVGEVVFVPNIEKSVVLSRTGHRSPVTGNRSSQLFQLPDGSAGHFTIRNRRDGDRFQPLGMPVDKKLKDFLIDRKIAAEERDRIPLLVWNDQIVWVGGVEISERFKVTDPAAELYEVRLERDGTITAGEESVQR
jgi:tRNA(Ile)-lysidine synthase